MKGGAMDEDRKKLLMDCFIGVACMILYPLALGFCIHAWLHWDWISKTIWTIGAIYMPMGAIAAFIRVGQWIER